MVSLTPKKMGVQAIGKSCSMGLNIGRMPENRGFEQQELLSQAPKSIKNAMTAMKFMKLASSYPPGFLLSTPQCVFFKITSPRKTEEPKATCPNLSDQVRQRVTWLPPSPSHHFMGCKDHIYINMYICICIYVYIYIYIYILYVYICMYKI